MGRLLQTFLIRGKKSGCDSHVFMNLKGLGPSWNSMIELIIDNGPISFYQGLRKKGGGILQSSPD